MVLLSRSHFEPVAPSDSPLEGSWNPVKSSVKFTSVKHNELDGNPHAVSSTVSVLGLFHLTFPIASRPHPLCKPVAASAAIRSHCSTELADSGRQRRNKPGTCLQSTNSRQLTASTGTVEPTHRYVHGLVLNEIRGIPPKFQDLVEQRVPGIFFRSRESF